MGNIKKKILITDYNVSSKILSNSSMLALLDSKIKDEYTFVVVLNSHCDVYEELKKRGITTYISKYGDTSKLINIFNHLMLPFKYILILLKERPNLIYANNVMAAKSGVLLKYLSFKPLIVHIRNVGFFKRTKFFCLLADHFLCVSKYCLINTLPPNYHFKADVIYDGVDTSKFANITNSFRGYKKEPGDFVIGMVGRITPQKGQDYFVKLASNLSKKYPNLIFVHCGELPNYGDSEYSESLIKNSDNLVCSKKFFWFDYSNNIENFWGLVDIGITPSQDDEAFGRVIIEAMAAKIPVITTDSGGPSEIIENNINGICVPKHDYPALELSIEKLLFDTELREKFINRGLSLVEQKFSLDSYASHFLKIIKTI